MPAMHDDVTKSAKREVEALLRGLPAPSSSTRVLLYEGIRDAQVGVVSVEAWLRELDWDGLAPRRVAARKQRSRTAREARRVRAEAWRPRARRRVRSRALCASGAGAGGAGDDRELGVGQGHVQQRRRAGIKQYDASCGRARSP